MSESFVIGPQYRHIVMREGVYQEFDMDLSDIIEDGGTVESVTMPETASSGLGQPFGIAVTTDKLFGIPSNAEETAFTVVVVSTNGGNYNFLIQVDVLPKLEAEDTESPSAVAAFLFPSAYDIGTITTNNATHAVNQSAETLSALAADLNIYFASIEKLFKAQVTDGKLRIRTNDGAVIESAKTIGDVSIPISEIQESEPVVANGHYFAREDPSDTDSEYSKYTLIKTCQCE